MQPKPPSFAFRPADPFRKDRSGPVSAKAARKAEKVRVIDARQMEECVRRLGSLPGPGESVHMVTDEASHSWGLIAAIPELAGGATVADLGIATLSFGRSVIRQLLAMFDAGKVGRVSIVASTYFEAHNPALFQAARDALAKRGQRLVADRNHAKVVTLGMSDGRKFVMEGSANLRACAAREQVALICDQALYEFHRSWIERVFR